MMLLFTCLTLTFSISIPDYFLMHTAKCAGSSINKDLMKLGILSNEGKEICLSCAIENGNKIISSFRSPRQHIISQYFFQRDSGGWCIIESSQSRCCQFPRVHRDDSSELRQYLDFYLNKSWSPGLFSSRYFG